MTLKRFDRLLEEREIELTEVQKQWYDSAELQKSSGSTEKTFTYLKRKSEDKSNKETHLTMQHLIKMRKLLVLCSTDVWRPPKCISLDHFAGTQHGDLFSVFIFCCLYFIASLYFSPKS